MASNNKSKHHFKEFVLALILILIVWVACMTSGNDILVHIALWFSVVFLLVMLTIVGINVVVDFVDLARVWNWLVGDCFLDKCKTIVDAAVDGGFEEDVPNRKFATFLVLVCGIIGGFLARCLFLYSMCIILDNGLFGVPSWYWLSLVIFEVIAIPAVFVHFALPVIDQELQTL